jgi:spore maturation protein CgeB
MNQLSRNLQALRRRQPELAERIARLGDSTPGVEILRAASGAATISLDDRLEASSEDPEDEGRRLAAHFLDHARQVGAARLALFGMGVHTLRFMGGFDGELLAIEPSAALCRAVLERVDLAGILGRVELVVGEDPVDALGSPVFRGEARGVFLSHATARRRAPRLHDALAARFNAGGVSSPLDIAVIPPLFGGSLPIAGSCARALRELGHRVRDIDLAPFCASYEEIHRLTRDPRLKSARAVLGSGLQRLIGESLIASFHLDPPDLVLGIAQAPLDPETLAKLRRLGIRSAFWFCEDFSVMDYWKEICSSYDVFFHLQPDEYSEPLREAGAYGAPLFLGFDPAHFQRPESEVVPRYDVSFVGAAYHNRLQFLPGLIDLGLEIFGVHWPESSPFKEAMPRPNEWLSPSESAQIFHATRININLHSSPWVDGVNPVGDYLNPRSFELAGAGAFQLVDERRDLARFFQIGSEVETFADLAQCRQKISYYLEHPQERQEIAERARLRALAEHTYVHRMREAIDVLENGPAHLMPRQRRAQTPASISEITPEEPGLCRVLSRLDAARELDADSITEAVARGDGPLSREEKILLFMRETLGELTAASQVEPGA